MINNRCSRLKFSENSKNHTAKPLTSRNNAIPMQCQKCLVSLAHSTKEHLKFIFRERQYSYRILRVKLCIENFFSHDNTANESRTVKMSKTEIFSNARRFFGEHILFAESRLIRCRIGWKIRKKHHCSARSAKIGTFLLKYIFDIFWNGNKCSKYWAMDNDSRFIRFLVERYLLGVIFHAAGVI